MSVKTKFFHFSLIFSILQPFLVSHCWTFESKTCRCQMKPECSELKCSSENMIIKMNPLLFGNENPNLIDWSSQARPDYIGSSEDLSLVYEKPLGSKYMKDQIIEPDEKILFEVSDFKFVRKT